MLHTPQSTAAQTVFSSISSATLMQTVRTIASVPGSFSQKRIKNKLYWYYQTPDLTGKQIQIFKALAPTNSALWSTCIAMVTPKRII